LVTAVPWPEIEAAIKTHKLAAAAVISGNRNFEGRVHPLVQANYLASPALVVAYALTGTIRLDLTSEPIGVDTNGQPVYLRDLWPSTEEINAAITAYVTPQLFQNNYADLFKGDADWQSIQSELQPFTTGAASPLTFKSRLSLMY
jgi:aconitate hydratase